MRSKVFGIGLKKTGTTSLGDALKQLGYHVSSEMLCVAPGMTYAGLMEKAELRLAAHDAFQDFPWFVLYRELEQKYPDAKFVLTVRDPQKWIESCKSYFRNYHRRDVEYFFGVPTIEGNEARCIEMYEQHVAGVQDYFKDKPGKLLTLDLSDPEAAKKLTKFLGTEQTLDEIPRKNATGSFRTFVQRHAAGAGKHALYVLDSRLSAEATVTRSR